MEREQLERMVERGEAIWDDERYCYWVDDECYNTSGQRLRTPTGEDWGDGVW